MTDDRRKGFISGRKTAEMPQTFIDSLLGNGHQVILVKDAVEQK